MSEFEKEVAARLENVPNEMKMIEAAAAFVLESTPPKYSYNFSWLGRPIIQYPQDMVAMQEIIWNVKPDLIIETVNFNGFFTKHVFININIFKHSLNIVSCFFESN